MALLPMHPSAPLPCAPPNARAQTIAGAAGHPAFRRALELVAERAAGGVDYEHTSFVHHHTGPGVWTAAVKGVLGVGDAEMSAGQLFQQVWSNETMFR